MGSTAPTRAEIHTLRGHQGQIEVDDWTAVGMLLAPAAWTASGAGRSLTGARWLLALAGTSALGSVGGMAGYMVWRYGVNGGKFPVKKEGAV